jgi:hypothetical protein
LTQPGRKYEVKTPNAVIGVIGTYFYDGYANGKTTVICYEGTLSVTPSLGAKVVDSNNSSTGSENTVSVAPGEVVVIGTKPERGGKPSYSNMRSASLKDADIGETTHPHFGRTLAFVSIAAIAGLTLGLTQINSSSKPCGCK